MPNTEMKYRDVPLSPHAEVLDQASVNFNALIKQSAERLLPLLGERIHLRSFCATGLSPVVISPTQIEDILGRLFVKAREEMQPGGLVLLQTAHSTNPPGSYPSHVVLTFRCMAGEMDHVQTVVQIAVNANPA